jgi:hypothetical protein
VDFSCVYYDLAYDVTIAIDKHEDIGIVRLLCLQVRHGDMFSWSLGNFRIESFLKVFIVI